MGEPILYFLLFVVSLAVLLRASDWFIDSAEQIGLSLGVSPFIIGVTIVAFGTSLPELATSIASVLSEESEIVIGNVVGSNITNIALVLGLAAIVVGRIELEYNIWHIDMPYLWGSAFLLWFALQDFHFSLFESFLFTAGLVVFLMYSFRDQDSPEEKMERQKAGWRVYALLVLGGALVYLGASYTIFAIKKLSLIAGINPEIIALSAVALGTSLPEVIVSLNAARRGKASIAVGNVLGSNIFNTYIVMGIPSFFGELIVPPDINEMYLPLMIAMTVLFGIMANNRKITRWEGMVLIIFYLFFCAELLDGAFL
jgi:cation:H+ antiporter